MSSTDNPHRRVVITGLGVICPLGNSAQAMCDALDAGRSGVRRFSQFPLLEGQIVFGGEALDFTGAIGDFGELGKDRKKAIRKAMKVMCRESTMGVAAAQQAVADAGFADEPMDPEQSGIVFGSDYMLSPPFDFIDGMVRCAADKGQFDYPRWGQDGLDEMNPLWMLKYLPNMPASHIAIFNDLRGPNNSLTLREVAGLMAVREAAQTVARGHADRMIAGATGTRIHPFKTVHALQQGELADPRCEPSTASRPFDANRTGMVLGEGAGAVVVEELEAARSRGATIYGEILGTGSSTVTDADLQGRPDQALTNAAHTALAEAKISPDDLGHVNAHGLATSKTDAAEARALREVLGTRADTIPVVAAKSYFGNLGAASGVIELIASVMALRHDRLFKTLNFESPDADYPLAVTTTGDLPSGQSFLKLSVTPQAQAAAVVIATAE